MTVMALLISKNNMQGLTFPLTCMGRDLDLKEREHEVKLQSLADSQRSAMMEIRQLLNAQQRMSAK